MKRYLLFSLLFLVSLFTHSDMSFSQGGSSGTETSFRFLDSNYRGEKFSEEKIIQSVRANFDVSAYREIRIAVMNGEGGLPYMPMPLAPESSTGYGFADQHFQRERWAGDKLLDGAGSDAADAVGPAPVEAESELVEVGLQVLWLHRAGMRAEQPALQE